MLTVHTYEKVKESLSLQGQNLEAFKSLCALLAHEETQRFSEITLEDIKSICKTIHGTNEKIINLCSAEVAK